jgi:2-polyprenyl-3-methyl-5-hydroxy-6-metoxy-1,4-benzoquinol methylase
MRAVSEKIARWIFSNLVDYDYKFRYVRPYLGNSVLDIGCGSGTLISFLQHGASYTGIDVDRGYISRLKSQHPEYAFFCLDLDDDTLPDPLMDISFSSIVILAVIEHLRRPDLFLSQCRTLMCDGTLLIISTPTRIGDLVSRIFERACVAPKGTIVHPHVKVYNRKSLCTMGQAHGLACEFYGRLGWHRQNQLFIFTKAKPGITGSFTEVV